MMLSWKRLTYWSRSVSGAGHPYETSSAADGSNFALLATGWTDGKSVTSFHRSDCLDGCVQPPAFAAGLLFFSAESFRTEYHVFGRSAGRQRRPAFDEQLQLRIERQVLCISCARRVNLVERPFRWRNDRLSQNIDDQISADFSVNQTLA
jgi:hypothetical protein